MTERPAHREAGDDEETIARDRAESVSAPERFPRGSGAHDLDGLLAAYLLDMDVVEPPPADRPRDVLVVEPDTTLRRALWEMLEAAGYSVTTAPSASGALELLARHRVDLVLVDDGADGSGRWLRDAVRAKSLDLPVILMSSDPLLVATWCAEGLSAGGCVEKPIRGLLVLAAIRDAIEVSRR